MNNNPINELMKVLESGKLIDRGEFVADLSTSIFGNYNSIISTGKNKHGDEVVIKFYPDYVHEWGRLEERFIREVRASQRVKGIDGVVDYYSSGFKKEIPYIVFKKFGEGDTLEDIARSPRRFRKSYLDSILHSPGEFSEMDEFKKESLTTLDIAFDLAYPLHDIHKRGVLHLDIKPQNILEYKDELIYSDFGVSRIIGEDELTVGSNYEVTPMYFAPEQATPEGKLNYGTDIFSLGLIYYELLFKERRKDKIKNFELSDGTLEKRLPIPKDMKFKYRKERRFRDLIFAMTEVEQRYRPHDMGEVISELKYIDRTWF